MVVNKFVDDIKILCESQGINQSQLAERMNVPRQAVHKYALKAGVTSKYIEMCESLGYDIEIKYVKK